MDLLSPGYYITESDNILILYPEIDGKMYMETNNDFSDNKWVKNEIDYVTLILLNATYTFDYIGEL